jgi:hypothetical protein
VEGGGPREGSETCRAHAGFASRLSPRGVWERWTTEDWGSYNGSGGAEPAVWLRRRGER